MLNSTSKSPGKANDAGALHANPHPLILIGENSFIRLSTDGGKTAATRCSHWRVLWTPAGAGHALFVDSPVTQGVRIWADREPLARFLQKEIEYLLHKPFGDASIPVLPATFERDGLPPGESRERARAGQDEIILSWSRYLAPFNFSADPGFDGRPIGVQTTFFPASAAQFTVGDRKAEGEPGRWSGAASHAPALAWRGVKRGFGRNDSRSAG